MTTTIFLTPKKPANIYEEERLSLKLRKNVQFHTVEVKLASSYALNVIDMFNHVLQFYNYETLSPAFSNAFCIIHYYKLKSNQIVH